MSAIDSLISSNPTPAPSAQPSVGGGSAIDQLIGGTPKMTTVSPETQTRQERIDQGLPVSVNPNKAAPSFVSENFIRPLLKPFASILQSVQDIGDTVSGKETHPTYTKYLGTVHRVGETFDPAEGITAENNIKAIKDATGKALEIVSNMVGGEGISTAVEESVKTAVKRAFIRGIKTGAGAGALQGAGAGLEENGSLEDIALGALKGAGMGAAFGGILDPLLTATGHVLRPGTPEYAKEAIDRAKAKIETPDIPVEQTKVNAAAEKVNPEGFRPVAEGEVVPKGATTKMDTTSGTLMTDAPVQGAPSKVGQSIQAKAIEAGLTKGFEGTAEYDPITIKNQAERMAPLLEDTERLGRIARGEEAIPEGIRTGAFIKAVEDHATATKNVELLRDLANSPLTSETSLHAQELRLLRERDPNSVLSKVKDIEETRKAKVEKVKGAKIKKEAKAAKAEAKKAAKFTIEDADKLLQSLIC